MYGGVDLGGTKIEVVVVDEQHAVKGQARRATPTTGGPPTVVEAIAEAVREAASAAGIEPSSLGGIGVGSPGEVENGTVAQARNLPDWEDAFPLSSALSEQLGAPVEVGNDVGVAVDAEAALGAGKPYASFLGVWWGTGVGGAFVIDGKRWLGRGAAGEIGHTVVKLDGARCPCGRKGCLEAYAGRAAMEAHARKAVAEGKKTVLFELMEKRGRTRLTSGIWERALKEEDKLAERVMERAIKALGAGIASQVNFLDVEAVVIGGGLGTRLGEPYAERIEQAMMPHLFVTDRPPAVHVAALGDLGGAIGATLLAAQAASRKATISA
ncbi:MAG TPA: ROK family protein [Gaiellaceae bacterium]